MAKLKEIAEINPTEALKKNSLAKYVAMENLQPFTRKISKYEEKRYQGGMKFRNGDTLMARITPCLENGKTAYVDILENEEVGFGSTEYIVIREKEGISDSKYLYYLAISPRFREVAIKAMSGTSGRQRVELDVLKNIEINLPPLSEQHRIANILSSFDNKIELLRKENNTLEDIAQSIFKEWFVKYNFPNKDGKPYRDNNGKMIDSELGLIPEGWRVGKLGEVITLQTGFVHNTSITGPAKSLIAKMGVVDGISRFNRNSVIPYSKSIDSKYKLEENDLIVCTRDVTRDNLVIGNVSQTPPDLAVRGLYAGSNTWIIKSNLNKNYLFLYLRERKFREHIIKSSKGSTIVMITQDAFLKCPYIFPQEEIINLFNETNEDLFKKAKVNDQEIQNLENIKSHLLNKLLT